jgi:hypothetical protein
VDLARFHFEPGVVERLDTRKFLPDQAHAQERFHVAFGVSGSALGVATQASALLF